MKLILVAAIIASVFSVSMFGGWIDWQHIEFSDIEEAIATFDIAVAGPGV